MRFGVVGKRRTMTEVTSYFRMNSFFFRVFIEAILFFWLAEESY